jgi:hypothetical protein
MISVKLELWLWLRKGFLEKSAAIKNRFNTYVRPTPGGKHVPVSTSAILAKENVFSRISMGGGSDACASGRESGHT